MLLTQEIFIFYVNIVWWAVIALTVVHFAACSILPDRLMIKILPFHDAFTLRKSVDLNYQTLSYALVHTKWFANITHLTLIFDSVAWFLLFFIWHWSVPVIVTLGLGLQILFFREWKFAVILLFVWAAVISIAYYTFTHFSGETVAPVVQLYLLASALFRFIGHAAEPIPPLILNKTDKFVRLTKRNFSYKILLLIPLGIIAEFAAGLPTRLLPVQVFIVSQWWLNLSPLRFMNWSKVKFLSDKIHQHGLHVTPQTASLYETVSGNNTTKNELVGNARI